MMGPQVKPAERPFLPVDTVMDRPCRALIRRTILDDVSVQARKAKEHFGGRSVSCAECIKAGNMSDSYIIEVSSQPAGIVVRGPGGYRFFAASHRFNRLEGQLFRNAREAERAARRLAVGDMTLAA